MRVSGWVVGGMLAMIATLVPVAAQPAAANTWDFGSTPFDDVVSAAGTHARCGLTQRQLAAMVIAVTYPEAGATAARTSPSPMALSRWDNQSGLYSFGNPNNYREAFWHPGIGMFQFDSAGGWPMNAAQRISTASSADQAARTMADRWCVNPSRSHAWALWFGCGGGVCENIYQQIYDPALDRTRNIVRDYGVGRGGGMSQRTCSTPGRGNFACWYVNPQAAQGTRTFLLEHFGPTPVSDPFYTFTRNGREERHWLRDDTGYNIGVRATRPLTANARTSLSWSTSEVLCDETANRGACSGNEGQFGTSPVNTPGSLTPLVGDFNGNGRSQVFLYDRGGSQDRLISFDPSGAPSSRSFTITGLYQPLVGDFDGNGQDDILWYAPGPTRDFIWFGRSDGGFNSYEVSIDGRYQPLVGDFDGNGAQDVFWYAPGPTRDYVWYGQAGGNFNSREVSVNGRYEPFVGNFDGSRRDDVFWYAPGPTRDYVWFGNANRTFTSREVSVDGRFRPFVGDFDGSGRQDVFWYGGGTANWIWYGNANRTFASSGRNSVTGDYTTAAGRFWGSADSIVWYGNTARSFLWTSRPGRTYNSSELHVGSGFDPLVGDFNGDGREDLFWYGAGTSQLWLSE